MPYIDVPLFQTTNPAVGDLLDRAISALIIQWHRDGQHNPPELAFATLVQSHLHALAISETISETFARHESSPSVSQDDRPDYLSVMEAAKRLKMTPQGVTKACRTGRLTATRDGRSYMIDPRSVEALIAEKEPKSA